MQSHQIILAGAPNNYYLACINTLFTFASYSSLTMVGHAWNMFHQRRNHIGMYVLSALDICGMCVWLLVQMCCILLAMIWHACIRVYVVGIWRTN